MYRDKIIRKMSIALTIVASAAFFAGCSQKEANNDNSNTESSQVTNQEISYDNETTVFVVDNTEIKIGEAMWYVYFIENEMSEDAKYYRENYGESYYDQEGNEEGDTVRELAKKEIIDMVYYYEILYSMADELGYKVEDESVLTQQANEFMDSANSEIIEKYNLEQSYYETILKKWSMADLYRQHVLSQYEVDSDELMKKNYSKEELDTLTEKEYEEIANELDSNCREQIFRDEFANIEKEHEIKIINNVWNNVPVGD